MAKVLQVFEPPHGGVAIHVRQLAEGLGTHGYQVEVAAPPHAMVVKPLREAGVPMHCLNLHRTYRRPHHDLAVLWKLVSLCRATRYDIVHCHSSKAGVLGRLAAAIAGVPSVYSPHCFGFVGDVALLRKAFSTAAECALGWTCTTAIVCVCEAERQRALGRRIAPRQRIHRIYLGVEDCQIDREPSRELQELRGNGTLAGTVTVLRPQKRVDVLLEAAPRVLKEVPDARIAIVGDGELRDDLHAQARALGLHRSQRFRFLPFSSPSASYLRALDVFVLPSAWEGMPISILEALACGVPQVATDVDGNGEATVPETGILVPPRDPDALADAIVALLRERDRRSALSRASVARHADRFRLERMVNETAVLYDDILAHS
jgi:glycosyltransferase involved in cell wall biosynthesis